MFFRPFLLSFGFLTHIPLPRQVQNYSNKDLGYSVLTYPIVGAVIGLLLLAAYHFLPALDVDVDAALLLILWNLLTGGLHIDGLCDSADAWIGGHHNRERALEIMQDASCGPIGVMVVVSVLILKFACLKTLMMHHAIIIPLFFTPVISRTAVIGLLLSTKYQQPDELGAILQNYLPKWPAIFVITICCILLISLTGKVGLKILFITMIGGYLLRKLMQKRIGGMTGDTAGAFIEIIETMILTTLALCS